MKIWGDGGMLVISWPNVKIEIERDGAGYCILENGRWRAGKFGCNTRAEEAAEEINDAINITTTPPKDE